MAAIIKGIAGIVNTISGLFLDDSPQGRAEAVRKLYSDPRQVLGVPYAGVIDPGHTRYHMVGPLAGVRALDGARALGDETQQTPQDEIVNVALYETQKALRMNELIKELPFVTFDSFNIFVDQSYQVTIPSGMSIVQTNYCSPIMNLGQNFKDLIDEYLVYKVAGIEVTINMQNQNYSTQTIAYDPMVTHDDIVTMQEDLGRLATGADPSTAATGHMVKYYWGSVTATDPNVRDPNGREIGTINEYLRALSDITSLENATKYPIGTAAAMGIEGPSFRLISMRPDRTSNPVEQDPNSYLSFDAARDFFKQFEQSNDTFYVNQMPVFGKFYFALSNLFEKDVDLITGIKYHLVCKRRRPGKGYLPHA